MANQLFSKNYFEIFDIPVSIEVDLNKVSESYHDLQKEFHPDRFSNSDESERRAAVQTTSLINQAFQTLKEPISRVQYMLKLKGVDIDSESDTTMDTEFLMQQMEFREAIAEVRSKDDPLEVLDQMASDLKKQINQLMNDFSKSYEASELDVAREIVRKMQFLIKAQKEVNETSEQLEDELF